MHLKPANKQRKRIVWISVILLLLVFLVVIPCVWYHNPIITGSDTLSKEQEERILSYSRLLMPDFFGFEVRAQFIRVDQSTCTAHMVSFFPPWKTTVWYAGDIPYWEHWIRH